MRADVFVFACLGVCLCCVRLCARVCVGRVCVVARPYVFACLRVGVAGCIFLSLDWLVSFVSWLRVVMWVRFVFAAGGLLVCLFSWFLCLCVGS